jgi:hypothetical protein
MIDTHERARDATMNKSPFQDLAPSEPSLTDYDRTHGGVYLRLLDADEAGADWQEVVAIVFGLDPAHEPERSQAMHASHLERARWISQKGYRKLVWRDA